MHLRLSVEPKKGEYMEVWRPRTGELIQVWDHYAERTKDEVKINNHGDLGYVIGESKRTDSFKNRKVTAFSL